ncbi:hypothetical protein [Natronomonas sp.]|uniref:hypothetical protein n=1 Tax=Natronomonas sp. TaxID=2184060 RepID=UPI002FC36EED
MESNETGVGQEGPVRLLLAAALAVVAIGSFRRQKRVLAVLSGAGAVALGYAATAGSAESQAGPEARSIEPTSRSREMRCGICGEPIVSGQGRRPHAEYGTVHDACLE